MKMLSYPVKLYNMKNLIKAFQIFLKYEKGQVITCEHDVMYVQVNPDDVSEEDKDELNELGFDVDYDLNNFCSYRYGSC